MPAHDFVRSVPTVHSFGCDLHSTFTKQQITICLPCAELCMSALLIYLVLGGLPKKLWLNFFLERCLQPWVRLPGQLGKRTGAEKSCLVDPLRDFSFWLL